MPRYGKTLEKYFEQQGRNLSRASILSLGIRLIDIFEQVHSAGYTYNDLKLDNLLIGFQEKLPHHYSDNDCFANCSVNLLDFGFASRFQKKHTHEILPQKELEVFHGNMLFSSINQLNFQSTSRRDDLISLGYLLVFLFNRGNMPGINLYDELSRNESFKLIR
jgi:serine/threonine protein kinase